MLALTAPTNTCDVISIVIIIISPINCPGRSRAMQISGFDAPVERRQIHALLDLLVLQVWLTLSDVC